MTVVELKIDQLRDLLDLHNRRVASMVALAGVIETTVPGDPCERFADNRDRAYVFVGPKDKLISEWCEEKDGSVTFTIKVAKP